MNAPESFLVAETHASFRPEKRLALQEAFDLVGAAIQLARENEIERLLADTTKLTGFGSPGVWQRFLMGRLFAEKAKGRVKVAVVARSELIDPARFGVTVARNRGLQANVFDSDTDALGWLLDSEAR